MNWLKKTKSESGQVAIIFALSIILFPQMVLNILTAFNLPWVVDANIIVTQFINNQWAYGTVYFVLVVLFTFFYTAVTFDPERSSRGLEIAQAMIKSD